MSDDAPRTPLDDLRDLAVGFARANGRPTWTEWLALGAEGRALLEAAGEHVALERTRSLAGAVGAACGGHPALIAAVLGDRALERDVAMEQAERDALKARGGNVR